MKKTTREKVSAKAHVVMMVVVFQWRNSSRYLILLAFLLYFKQFLCYNYYLLIMEWVADTTAAVAVGGGALHVIRIPSCGILLKQDITNRYFFFSNTTTAEILRQDKNSLTAQSPLSTS